jgi:hypothetical protein
MDGAADGRLRAAVAWAVAAAAFGLLTLAGAIGMTMARSYGAADIWVRLGALGEVFSALFAGLAFVILRTQVNEFREQRAELALQRRSVDAAREELAKTSEELRRSGAVGLRRLHVALLKMATDDPDLARVWAPPIANLPPTRHKQYMYANLIIQHIWLGSEIGDYSDADVAAALRHAFQSEILRDFWRDTAHHRRVGLVSGSREARFMKFVDDICEEYSAVASFARPAVRRRRRLSTEQWEATDHDPTGGVIPEQRQ